MKQPIRMRGQIVATVATCMLSVLAAPAGAAARARAAASVGAAALPVTAGSGYLALGDSVTFGYMESGVVPAPNYNRAASFLGYPELIARTLHLKVANAACPGETSASLVDRSAQSNGCENGYRGKYPLHVHYRGSQLAYAVSYLRSHSNVRLVSLMIGANDGLLCLEKDGCSKPSEVAAVAATVRGNVHKILAAVRHRAHYRGQIVVLEYYSPLVGYNARTLALNKAIVEGTSGFGAEIANAFATFATADKHSGGDPCAAGLITQLGAPDKCGIHPSYAGQALLAQTVENAIRL